jgi:DNA-binding transcriptional MerR regulator
MPDEPTTRTYTIGAFAAQAAVTTRTLRYYDRIGFLGPAALAEGGRRLYSPAELVTLQQILALKLLGFTLAEIRACLHTGPQDFVRALAAANWTQLSAPSSSSSTPPAPMKTGNS